MDIRKNSQFVFKFCTCHAHKFLYRNQRHHKTSHPRALVDKEKGPNQGWHIKHYSTTSKKFTLEENPWQTNFTSQKKEGKGESNSKSGYMDRSHCQVESLVIFFASRAFHWCHYHRALHSCCGWWGQNALQVWLHIPRAPSRERDNSPSNTQIRRFASPLQQNIWWFYHNKYTHWRL